MLRGVSCRHREVHDRQQRRGAGPRMARGRQWLHLLFCEVAPSFINIAPMLTSGRDQGVAAIESLMEKSGAFDYILLETTGLADPGNLAPLFWVDDGLGSTIYLDGIVTLIDAKNILKSLNEPADETVHHEDHAGPVLTTAHLQISHADIIVINKSDLVGKDDLEIVKARVTAINGLAKIHVTEKGRVPQLEGFLLDLHAYDRVGALDVAAKGHSHMDPVSRPKMRMSPTEAKRFQSISTITVVVPVLKVHQLPKLDAWLRSILWDSTLPSLDTEPDCRGFEIHRLKARIQFADGTAKIVQGVREVFEIIDEPTCTETTDGVRRSEGKVVLIGRNLGGLPFLESFMNTIRS